MVYCSGSNSSIQKSSVVSRFRGIKPKLADNKFAIIRDLLAKKISDFCGEESGKLRL